MVDETSVDLTALAYKAGFHNLHGFPSHTSCLMGSIIADDFEILYFLLGAYKEQSQTVDVFAVREQSDPETCVLYRFERRELEGALVDSSPGRGGINLRKRVPLHTGQTAVDVLESYARQLDEEPAPYQWWVRRNEVVQGE